MIRYPRSGSASGVACLDQTQWESSAREEEIVPSLEGRRGAAAGVVTRSVAAFPAVAMTTRDRMARLLALARVIGRRETLDDAISSEHAPIDGKVPAHHKGPHRSVLLGQSVRFVRNVRLVLAAIDENQTGVPAGVPIALVGRVLPPTAPAQALKVLNVEATHGCAFAELFDWPLPELGQLIPA